MRILGIAYGHELLDPVTQSRVRDLFGTGDSLDRFIFFFYICCSPQGGARICVYWTESIYISSSLQSLQMARSRPARRSSFSQARISAVSGERWSWRGGEDGGVVGGGGDGDDGVGGAGGESGADRRSSSSQARIRVLSQSR